MRIVYDQPGKVSSHFNLADAHAARNRPADVIAEAERGLDRQR